MYRSIVVVCSALVGLAFAQTAIPACATSCITLPTQCNLDPSCICTDTQWISDISCCIFKSCDEAGQQQALAYAQTICTPVGATLPSQASCDNGTSSANSTSSTASSSGASSSASSSATGAAGSASSSASSAASSASSAASSAGSSASSATSAAASSASSAAKGNQVIAEVGGVLGAILGVAALM